MRLLCLSGTVVFISVHAVPRILLLRGDLYDSSEPEAAAASALYAAVKATGGGMHQN